MFVVRVKPGVLFERIAPAGFVILAAIHSGTQVLGRDLTLSCGTDSHPLGDPHVRGEAYDLSVAGDPADQVFRLVGYLRSALGERFTVLYECPTPPADARLAAIATINPQATAPHVHVQLRKGTTFPPTAALNA